MDLRQIWQEGVDWIHVAQDETSGMLLGIQCNEPLGSIKGVNFFFDGIRKLADRWIKGNVEEGDHVEK
jgi:hypothetical protein